MRRWWPLAAAVAAVAILVGVVGAALGWWSGADPRNPPLSLAATLSPQETLFGDRVVAQVDVVGGDARVQPSFAPFVARGTPQVTHDRIGRLRHTRYRWSLECLDDPCLPLTKPVVVQLKPLQVAGQTVAWPRVVIASRVTAQDEAARTLPFRTAALPAPRWRIAPTPLAIALAVVAGLLAAAALVLLGIELRRLAARIRAGRIAAMSPLERALYFTREAAGRPDPADRRKALELLAETIRPQAPDLAAETERTAWAEAPPTPERTLALAAEAEAS